MIFSRQLMYVAWVCSALFLFSDITAVHASDGGELHSQVIVQQDGVSLVETVIHLTGERDEDSRSIRTFRFRNKHDPFYGWYDIDGIVVRDENTGEVLGEEYVRIRELFGQIVLSFSWDFHIEERQVLVSYAVHDVIRNRDGRIVAEIPFLEIEGEDSRELTVLEVAVEAENPLVYRYAFDHSRPSMHVVIPLLGDEWVIHEKNLKHALWMWLRVAYYSLPFIVVLFLVFRWWRDGSRSRLLQHHVTQVTPPNEQPPGLLGMAYHGRVSVEVLTALLVDLAHRGYIRLVQDSRRNVFQFAGVSIELTRTDFDDPQVSHAEQILLRHLFRGDQAKEGDRLTLETVQHRLESSFPAIRAALIKGALNQGYFHEDPTLPRQRMIVAASAWAIVGVMILLFSGVAWREPLLSLPSLFVAGILIVASPYMPRRTKRGTRLADSTHAFGEYLREPVSSAAHPRTIDMCSRFLPYAILLSVEEQWVSSFENVIQHPPLWCEIRISNVTQAILEGVRLLQQTAEQVITHVETKYPYR